MTHRTTVLAAGILLLAGCFETPVADDASKVPDPGVEDVAGDAIADVPADLAPPTTVTNCTPCEADGECGTGARCLPVGATKYCLADCVDDGDCPPSYVCYAASSASKSCLPVSYNCVACASETPCKAGMVCDFVTGACKNGRTACDLCTFDFDCTADAPRCYKTSGSATGACVATCSDWAPCPDSVNFTCVTTDKGARLCQPLDPERCGGCDAATPFPSPEGTTCYECLNNSHCTWPKICDLSVVPYVCNEFPGSCGALRKCGDGRCGQCCVDADCTEPSDIPPTCGPDTHTCSYDEPCESCNQCVFPLPVLKVVNHVPQCVQCDTDLQCASIDPSCACTGAPTFECRRPDGSGCWSDVFNGCLSDAGCAAIDPTCTCTGDPTYTCLFPDGTACRSPDCGAMCSTDADCPPGADGGSLVCSNATGGVCLDPRGRCDGVTACCGPGQSCTDLVATLADAMKGEPGWPLMVPSPIPPMCPCDATHPCLGGAACAGTLQLCQIADWSDRICPGGVIPAWLPVGVCGDLQPLIEVLSGIAGAR